VWLIPTDSHKPQPRLDDFLGSCRALNLVARLSSASLAALAAAAATGCGPHLHAGPARPAYGTGQPEAGPARVVVCALLLDPPSRASTGLADCPESRVKAAPAGGFEGVGGGGEREERRCGAARPNGAEVAAGRPSALDTERGFGGGRAGGAVGVASAAAARGGAEGCGGASSLGNGGEMWADAEDDPDRDDDAGREEGGAWLPKLLERLESESRAGAEGVAGAEERAALPMIRNCLFIYAC
jgi:hypothetical protein